MISVDFSKVSELQGDPPLVAFGIIHRLSIFKAGHKFKLTAGTCLRVPLCCSHSTLSWLCVWIIARKPVSTSNHPFKTTRLCSPSNIGRSLWRRRDANRFVPNEIMFSFKELKIKRELAWRKHEMIFKRDYLKNTKGAKISDPQLF